MTRRRILLVEDHEASARAMAGLLRHAGYVVTTAHSVSGALAMAEGQPAYDAVVSDIALPDGDGCKLLARLRDTYGGRDVPAVAMSAHDSAALIDECRAAGYRTFVLKPVRFDQIAAALDAIFKGTPSADAS